MEKTKNAVGLTLKRRLGLSILNLAQGSTECVQVESSDIEIFDKKDGSTVEHVKVTNLSTGESGLTMWAGGQLKKELKDLASQGKLQNVKLQITLTGQASVPLIIDGKLKDTMVNQYDIFELE